MLEVETDLFDGFVDLFGVDLFSASLWFVELTFVERFLGGLGGGNVVVAHGVGDFDFRGCGRSVGFDGEGVIPFGGQIDFCRS